MLLSLGDWLLDVDTALTMELSGSQAREHCQCGYCRNYYKSLDSACPAVRPFLMRFGLDAEGPDELCPFEPTIYEASYIVQGSILRHGDQRLHVEDIPLQIISSNASDVETEHPQPYFILRLGLMELPWVLPEPMDQVISPANEEEFLRRMQNKLLQKLADDSVVS